MWRLKVDLHYSKSMADLLYKMSARESAEGLGSESTTKAHKICSSATRKIFLRMHFSEHSARANKSALYFVS